MRTLFYPTFLFAATTFAQVPAGAVGYWPFDGNANDLSGNGSHGTFTNTIPARDRFNVPNRAFKFNGLNSKVVVPHNSKVDVGTGDFTFAYWQKTYKDNINAATVTKHTYGLWDGYNFIANNQQNGGYCMGYKHLYWYVAAGAQEDACSDGPVLADTAWHFFVGIFEVSNNKSYLYVDNVLQSDVGKSSGPASCTADLSFGFDSYANDYFFNGVLDGARLYKRILTPAEIKALHLEGGYVPAGVMQHRGTVSRVTIYPNPSIGNFVIRTEGINDNCSYKIVNQFGAAVKSGVITSDFTEVRETLEPGIYFLELNDHRSKLIIAQ